MVNIFVYIYKKLLFFDMAEKIVNSKLPTNSETCALANGGLLTNLWYPPS